MADVASHSSPRTPQRSTHPPRGGDDIGPTQPCSPLCYLFTTQDRFCDARDAREWVSISRFPRRIPRPEFSAPLHSRRLTCFDVTAMPLPLAGTSSTLKRSGELVKAQKRGIKMTPSPPTRLLSSPPISPLMPPMRPQMPSPSQSPLQRRRERTLWEKQRQIRTKGSLPSQLVRTLPGQAGL